MKEQKKHHRTNPHLRIRGKKRPIGPDNKATIMKPKKSVTVRDVHGPAPPSSLFEPLPDECLSHILSFADLKGALFLTKRCSKSLTRRFSPSTKTKTKRRHGAEIAEYETSALDHHWKERFYRFNWNRDHSNSASVKGEDYLNRIKNRKRLSRNLTTSSKGRKGMASRHFNFFPLHPEEEDEYHPRRVHFACDSFSLTSPGVGGEMVLIDPFDGSIRIIPDISSPCKDDECSYSGTSEKSLHNILYGLKDYEAEAEHFLPDNSFEDEMVTDWIGVEVKLHGPLKLPMVVAVQTNEIGPLHRLGDAGMRRSPIRWSEILAWKKSKGNGYDCKMKTVLSGTPYYIDVCGMHQKVYVVYSLENHLTGRLIRNAGELALHRAAPQDGDDGVGRIHQRNNDTEPVLLRHSGAPASRTILRFPLLPAATSQNSTTTDCDPQLLPTTPELCIHCSAHVISFAVDALGENIVVGTTRGVEIWSTGLIVSSDADSSEHGTPKKIQNLDFGSLWRMEEDPSVDGGSDDGITGACRQNTFRQGHHHSPNSHLFTVSQVVLPQNLLMDVCGFVTVQSLDRSFALWQKPSIPGKSNQQFHLVAYICPNVDDAQVFYDGRRLLILGRDSIGVVLLVYYVLTSLEDRDQFLNKPQGEHLGKHSSLMHDCRDNPRIRLVNLIRHAALGAMSAYEPLLMTANERFIVVCTNHGDFFASSRGIGSWLSSSVNGGLLVIDLDG